MLKRHSRQNQETPKKEIEPVFRTKKEIKEHVYNQYAGTARMRYGIGKTGRYGHNRKSSKLLTNVFGMKNIKSASTIAHYDEQNKRRKAKKYADRKGLTWLGSGESLADLRKQNKISQHGNKQKKTKITTGIFSHNRVKKGNKS